ncbi:hypothetical protein MNBD_CPR01-221 [hydrothermal vent metagenome]|uniref:Uncharacterized protein n=1 Tax=hydrothermal vent metagenome TaxID=652676 RepID=A0A3B0UVV0_9ZZZZ
MSNNTKQEAQKLSYVIDFVKFLGGFVAVITIALITLHVVAVTASGQLANARSPIGAKTK